MFIQITKDKFIRKKDIIGVFDLDTSTTSSKTTKKFLNLAEKNAQIENIDILPKSFVLTDEKKDFVVYFSSSMTGHIYKNQKQRLSTI